MENNNLRQNEPLRQTLYETKEKLTTPRTVRIRSINFYASLAVSVIVSIIICASMFFVGWITSQIEDTISSSSAMSFFVFTSASLLFLTLFLALPAILNCKYGWKTVVVTILFQSIILFFGVTAISVITASNNPSTPEPRYYD